MVSRCFAGTPHDKIDAVAFVVIRALAGISADALLSDDTISIKDMELLKRFEIIQEMTGEDRKMILKFLDLTIRDYKTKKAYA